MLTLAKNRPKYFHSYFWLAFKRFSVSRCDPRGRDRRGFSRALIGGWKSRASSGRKSRNHRLSDWLRTSIPCNFEPVLVLELLIGRVQWSRGYIHDLRGSNDKCHDRSRIGVRVHDPRIHDKHDLRFYDPGGSPGSKPGIHLWSQRISGKKWYEFIIS